MKTKTTKSSKKAAVKKSASHKKTVKNSEAKFANDRVQILVPVVDDLVGSEAPALQAEIAAAEDGTGPAKAEALRSAAEVAGGTGNLVTGAVIPSAKPHATRACPDCGGEMPARYRVCDSCLEKRRTAKKAAGKIA